MTSRTASMTALVLFVAAGTASEAAEDRSHLPLPVRPCAVCHGNEGISELAGFPNLAGQKAGYLVKQTTEMHLSARALLGLGAGGVEGPPTRHQSLWTEHRENRTMARQSVMLDDAGIQAIAGYFAAKPRACPPPGVTRGTKLTLVERCAVCHGEDGIGATPNVPNLAGQHRLYLADQIRKMRSAERGEVFIDAEIARASGVMGPQAVQVPEDQIDALALWFANSPCAERK
ncbi:MAG: c-type cytochrome [Rhodospirillales bacterium]|nr:c-type cytochrome [Rhodospirillales bacterium]MSP79607.1 c-type cytochrome [Rhodospirillales bacterium]